jgi:tellurite resistance protein
MALASAGTAATRGAGRFGKRDFTESTLRMIGAGAADRSVAAHCPANHAMMIATVNTNAMVAVRVGMMDNEESQRFVHVQLKSRAIWTREKGLALDSQI